MFTEEQISKIAEKLNKKINLPVTGEKLELMIFKKVVREIGKKLGEILPDELLMLINQPQPALKPDANLEEIKSRISEKINERFNIPIIGEKVEIEVIKIVVDLVVECLRSQHTLNEILAKGEQTGTKDTDTPQTSVLTDTKPAEALLPQPNGV